MGKIRIGISACLLGENVRYNGGNSLDRLLRDTLGRYVEYVPVCPEVECGFGIPRETFRLMGDPKRPRLHGGIVLKRIAMHGPHKNIAMKVIGICGVVASIVMLSTINAKATEEPKYNVVANDGQFEIRDYAPHLLAEVVIVSTLEEAGNIAFNKLFRYISGSNRSRTKISMTAPVSQEARSEKIRMTAPVGQQPTEGGWTVSFTMPASYSMETLPEPDDPDIKLRQVPARRMAAVRYSGFWSESGYLRNKKALEEWIEERAHCHRSSGMGTLQPSFYSLVYEAERDSDSGKYSQCSENNPLIAWSVDACQRSDRLNPPWSHGQFQRFLKSSQTK